MFEQHSATTYLPPRASTPAASGKDRSIKAWIDSFPAGRVSMSASQYVFVRMHLGRSVDVRCSREGTNRYGREAAGDLEIIPARTPSEWEISRPSVRLIMRVPEGLLRSVAPRLGMAAASIEIADRFQVRDPVIEHIAWALKDDIEGRAGGQLIQDSLGVALAARLLHRHNVRSLPIRSFKGGLSAEVLKQILAYIDDNLSSKLSLEKISDIAGVSASHLQALFRNATGRSVHQYVLRRRIEHAQILLRDGDLSISQVALASGFAHQSHLARHMRRTLGSAPTTVRKSSRT
jgi:AraC family transcriptional regulator